MNTAKEMIRKLPRFLKTGTCSWKYDSWKGLVYSDNVGENYLSEYANFYNIVEVNQWFWSLFGDKVVLPKSETVSEYVGSVPKDFRFSVKVPMAKQINSLIFQFEYLNKQEMLLFKRFKKNGA
ncbi:MAG: DUF72 domain-containing protein [Proteobacteria bacterium]|nr:DUF72 domain-containing protein [Pseudomonadota bacterium]MBU1585974.1 DUF72 domain-containing protein [Pseudomonadota bacterium]MBU2629507.1 DUF72 domain-containing protein [Pseudomonadota bacterium]